VGEAFYYSIHQYDHPDEVLYTTKGKDFIYSDYFKLETAWLNTTGRVFGLGERVGDFWLKPGTYTIWIKD